MSALAKILHESGKKVAGCDRAEGEYTQMLREIGVEVAIGDGEPDGFSAVIYTDALSDNDRTLIKARRLGIPLISRGKLLSELTKTFKNTIAVAGCHGKTTCTAMIAHIFDAARLSFSSHIGGYDGVFSNGYLGGYDYFITEACEYKRNFLYLKPSVAVVLNTDADHLDCYGTAERLKEAYKTFAVGAGEVVALYGDMDDCDCITFGFDDRAAYYAKRIRSSSGRFYFDLYEYGNNLGTVKLSVYGKHNVLNALAAAAVARRYGVDFEDIAKGLGAFRGVRRRFENIGEYNGATCIADYAHHPNEIKAAIKAARLITEESLYVVFQPHTYSRTKNFFKKFVLTLSPLKKLLVYKTYAAREYYDNAGSALTLAGSIKKSVYGDCGTWCYSSARAIFTKSPKRLSPADKAGVSR